MTKIDLSIEKAAAKNAIKRAKERNIVIPTFAQMKDPSKIPASVRADLRSIGLWDLHPRNLFRITWHNEPKASGGGFGGVNYLELPSSLTGCSGPHRRAGGQVVPDRRAQGRGCLWMPGAEAGDRAVRSHDTEGRLAIHGQLLPRRRRTIRRCWPANRSPSCRRA